MPTHQVLLHGYLLQGTGSNIYVANIAKAWKAQGHAVTVVCQDRQAHRLPFVDEYIGPDEAIPATPPPFGHLRVVVPPIDELLPVYVADHYEGYQVKTIPEMTDAEVEAHIAMTAHALRQVAAQGVDGVLANHALLSPVIARRALASTAVPYSIKIHGSAIEFVLVPYPRFMPYAWEGLHEADHVFVGTQYVRDRVLHVFEDAPNDLNLAAKIRIVSPGMDPDLFRPVDDLSLGQSRFLDRVRERIDANPQGRRAHRVPPRGEATSEAYHQQLVRLGATYDQRAPDADLLEKWPQLQADEPLILYFGKFLKTKGVGELLLAVPEVLAQIPEARFVFVGFGTYREHLEAMIQALGTGDTGALSACGAAGDFVVPAALSRPRRPLTAEEQARITVTGILDHAALGALLPLADISIVPSKLAEAFGMVAVEAMSAGVLPLCNYHTGLRDVVDVVRTERPDLAHKMALDPEQLVEQLPVKIVEALQFLYPAGFADRRHRNEVGTALRQIAVDKFSWQGIAGRLLSADPSPV